MNRSLPRGKSTTNTCSEESFHQGAVCSFARTVACHADDHTSQIRRDLLRAQLFRLIKATNEHASVTNGVISELLAGRENQSYETSWEEVVISRAAEKNIN